MNRKIAGVIAVLVAAVVVLPAPGARAATPQIVDPALDHPLPWADLVSVELGVTKVRNRDFLSVTFTTSGEISDPSRNTLTGYTFQGKAGTCELTVLWYAFPMVTEPAGLPPGSPGAFCGAAGKDLGGSFTRKGNSVTVLVPMQDMAGKGVVKGASMTNLTAHTALLEGIAGDDTGLLANTGDAAASDKPWVIG